MSEMPKLDDAAIDNAGGNGNAKSHIALGLLLHAVVHPADVQDRDGAILVMATLFGL